MKVADAWHGDANEAIEEFVEPDNWPALLPEVAGAAVDVVIDACDRNAAKFAMARWSIATGRALVMAGAAGGKSHPERVEAADLADVTHDPLLARLRQQLRKAGAPRTGRIGVRCVFSREDVRRPPQDGADACAVDGSLNCHGYGSSVMVTASFGMVAAAQALELVRGA